MQRVRIGTCHGPADASLVRSMLSAHDIESVVSGEQHASMLGGLGGGLIQLDIWVAADDAEQASELLRDLREGAEIDASELPQGDDDESDEEAERSGARAIETSIDKRRRFGVVLLLSFCITFGTAHMYMGAWAIGLVLAATELSGITQLEAHPAIAASVLVSCIVFDAIGAIIRVRSIGRVELPRAQAR